MPPTTLAMDTREDDEEDPEVVEEEKEDSRDGVPFFTGDWKIQSTRITNFRQSYYERNHCSSKCTRSKDYCELLRPI